MKFIQNPGSQRSRGVTLVELMVALIVFAIGVSMAAPAFFDFRQRQALKGGVEEYMALLAERRMDAIKNNQSLTIDFNTVATRLPAGVTVAVAPSMGTAGVVRIDPKRGTLSNLTSGGSVTLQAGTYQLRFNVNVLGRGSVCSPSSNVPGYGAC